MGDVFIDVFFYDDDSEDETSECVAEYNKVDWKRIEKRIVVTIAEDGDFPINTINRIEIYSEDASDVIKVYEYRNLMSLLKYGLEKCNSIWR